MTAISRRRLIAGALAMAALHGSGLAAVLRPTPRQSAGPFYPTDIPLDDDNNLVRVKGRDGVAKGRVADVHGRLLDINGRPLKKQVIEIWQCDANGRYRHPRDPGTQNPDENFQGFGRMFTDAEGRYRFRTIRPVPYPGRTPHIHVAVLPDGESPFVTQLYVAGEPRNAGDFLYQRVPVEQRALVTAEFSASPEKDVLTAHWDIVLGATPA